MISLYLGGEPAILAKINNQVGRDNVVINAVINIELLNWLSGIVLDKSTRAKYLRYIKALPTILIDDNISREALAIVNKHINSKPGDTFIAATGLYCNLPIYTLNTKDFRRLGVTLF